MEWTQPGPEQAGQGTDEGKDRTDGTPQNGSRAGNQGRINNPPSTGTASSELRSS